MQLSRCVWDMHYDGITYWLVFVFVWFSARPLPFSMHRNTTLQVRETAPLPKKQVRATMSCFSGTTFYH